MRYCPFLININATARLRGVRSDLLYHDDVGAEHLEASCEEHDVAPAQDQTHGHHHLLALHLARPEHTQQYHQAGVADPAHSHTNHKVTRSTQGQAIHRPVNVCACGRLYAQDDVEGAPQRRLAEVALGPDSQYVGNLSDAEQENQPRVTTAGLLCVRSA